MCRNEARRCQILAIAGPTGAGKTTLSRILAQVLGCELVAEHIPQREFKLFARDPARHCAELQRIIIEGRAASIRERLDHPLLVLDRTLEEDREVFLRMHHELGYLTDGEHAELDAACRELESQLPGPTQTWYVSSPASELLPRLKRTDTPSPILENLDLQVRLYQEWRSAKSGPVLDIEMTSGLDSLGQLLALGR